MSNGTQLLIICILYIPGAQSYANCSSVYIRRAWLGHASCTTCCIVVTMEKLRRKNKRMGDRFAWPNLSSKERNVVPSQNTNSQKSVQRSLPLLCFLTVDLTK